MIPVLRSFHCETDTCSEHPVECVCVFFFFLACEIFKKKKMVWDFIGANENGFVRDKDSLGWALVGFVLFIFLKDNE